MTMMAKGNGEEQQPAEGEGGEHLLVASIDTVEQLPPAEGTTEPEATLPEENPIEGNLPEGGTAPEGTVPEGGTVPEELNNGPQEGTEPEPVTHDPEESKEPEDNRVDANGGSVSLSFSPKDKTGQSPTNGGSENAEKVEPTNEPAPAAPSAPSAGTDNAPAGSEPAAA